MMMIIDNFGLKNVINHIKFETKVSIIKFQMQIILFGFCFSSF
jgi:hypothetical protein